MTDIAKPESKDVIRVQVKDFKGKKYLDLRNFYEKDGEKKPTKRGISIPLDIAQDVIAVALKELGRQGPVTIKMNQ